MIYFVEIAVFVEKNSFIATKSASQFVDIKIVIIVGHYFVVFTRGNKSDIFLFRNSKNSPINVSDLCRNKRNKKEIYKVSEIFSNIKGESHFYHYF